jgi:hypothetical protein
MWDVDVGGDDHVLIFYTVIYCHYVEHTDELQLDDNGMILRRSSCSCTCVCVCVRVRVCRYTYVYICVYVGVGM